MSLVKHSLACAAVRLAPCASKVLQILWSILRLRISDVMCSAEEEHSNDACAIKRKEW